MAASQANMLAGLGKLTELKQRILFVIGALIVYRLGSFIPVPGVNSDAMSKLIEGQGGIVDMFNMFSGGSLKRFSLFALGVVPYISASIIVQMFASVIPAWQALRKEGESGRRKLTQWTRFGTVGLAATVNNLPTDGRQLYVTLYGYSGGWSVQDTATYSAATLLKAQITSPPKGSILTGSSVTFTWTAETGRKFDSEIDMRRIPSRP